MSWMNDDLFFDDALEMEEMPTPIPRAIQKRVIERGKGAPIPHEKRIRVKVLFRMRVLGTRTVFDNGNVIHPFTFTLRKGNVLPGLDLALSSMYQDETALFILPFELCYGALGCPPLIPPARDVMLECRMLSWVDPKPDTCSRILGDLARVKTLSLDMFQALIAQEKEIGNTQYRAGSYAKALEHYQRILQAIQCLAPSRRKKKECHGLSPQDWIPIRRPILANVAAAALKTAPPKLELVKHVCTQIIQDDATNKKGLYRRGKAYMASGHVDLACKDFSTGLAHYPDDKAFQLAFDMARKID